MAFTKRYSPQDAEPRLSDFWQQADIHHFTPNSDQPVFSIDTPPPTVSGHLHLGHVYSYTHPDLIARYKRMQGYQVFYPMGYDDNGLPTERLVEKTLGLKAETIGRSAFTQKCLEVSENAEREYQALWQRLGLSVDWRYTYRTIDENARRISQFSFINLYKQGRAYRSEAPAIWCPECQTSIAQAELNDLERESEFITIAFALDMGGILPIATTRPELLPACVAVFVHPEDDRYNQLIGESVQVPLFGRSVRIIPDPAADPAKGTGAVMCCTFGDTTDINWWHTYQLAFIEAIDARGRMTLAAGEFAGIPAQIGRLNITAKLAGRGYLLNRQSTNQSVRVHERCDTPVEYRMTKQWFIKLLDHKEELLAAGKTVNWHPENMAARYQAWVENLNWDWCLSRQRYFGVPFPLWYCQRCDQVILADPAQLPIDPQDAQPAFPCPNCGGTDFIAETDVLDTWATSSMTPQIVGRYSIEGHEKPVGDLYERVFPFSLRAQAHEIIRTWAFYTIAKSHYHFNHLPWKDVLISGWGIAGEGMGKISKSRGGGPVPPVEMIEQYSADAVRYWAASTGPGKDAVISEEKIQLGRKLVTKIWNVARFCQPFLSGYWLSGSGFAPTTLPLTAADRWILSRLQRLKVRVTELLDQYEYANAKTLIEAFFWTEFTDNYLEMCKQRLYDGNSPHHQAGQFTLYTVLLTIIQLFAPFLPFITEEIYQNLFAPQTGTKSIHQTSWPQVNPDFQDDTAEAVGEILVSIATAVRRFKSEHNRPLGSEIQRLQLATTDTELAKYLKNAEQDLSSITRAARIELVEQLQAGLEHLPTDTVPKIGLEV